MKCLVLTVLLMVAQASSPIPRQTSQNPPNNRTRNAQNTQKGKAQAPAPLPIQSKEHAVSAEGNGSKQASKHEQEHVIVDKWPDKDLWEKAYIIFTGTLALIGLFTLGAVIFQAVQTKHATVAMEKNIGLQKASLRQWVVVQGFREAVEPRFTTTSPQLELHLFFEIINPTEMPLTLEWYVISINATKHKSRLNFTLAPGKTHNFKASMDYTDEIRNKSTREGFDITITGVIAFTDVLTEFQKQRIGYLRKFRVVGAETLNYTGPLPDEDIEKEESEIE